ncbi:Hypothetical protein NocV09_00101060 [Nannochloropsis oceanica]
MPESEALQEEHLAKETARLAARARRDQGRLARLQNANRTTTVDVTALELQIEEKRRLKELELLAAAREGKHVAEMVRLRAAQEAQAIAARQALARTVKDEWALQAAACKDKNKKDINFTDLPVAKCGRGALQKLDGEDEGYSARKKQQHAEMRSWTQAQRQEQQERKSAEARTRAQEAAQLRRVLSLADQQAEGEAALRTFLTRQVQIENAAQIERHSLVKIQQLRQRQEEEQALLARMGVDPMLSEVNDCVNHETGRIVSDRFRGFSSAQRHALLEENKKVLQEKAARQQQEQEDARAWVKQQARWNALMEQQEEEERHARAALHQETYATLQLQKQEHKVRDARNRADAFGRIEEGQGLVSKFGTSLA